MFVNTLHAVKTPERWRRKTRSPVCSCGLPKPNRRIISIRPCWIAELFLRHSGGLTPRTAECVKRTETLLSGSVTGSGGRALRARMSIPVKFSSLMRSSFSAGSVSAPLPPQCPSHPRCQSRTTGESISFLRERVSIKGNYIFRAKNPSLVRR